MNSSDTEMRPHCPPPPGWKVLRDEDEDFLLRQSTQTLENILQLCEDAPKGKGAPYYNPYLKRFEKYTTVRTLDNTITIAVHHLTVELRRRRREGAKLRIYKEI